MKIKIKARRKGLPKEFNLKDWPLYCEGLTYEVDHYFSKNKKIVYFIVKRKHNEEIRNEIYYKTPDLEQDEICKKLEDISTFYLTLKEGEVIFPRWCPNCGFELKWGEIAKDELEAIEIISKCEDSNGDLICNICALQMREYQNFIKNEEEDKKGVGAFPFD